MIYNKWLQDRLTAHGYPVGVIDGIIGSKTTAALKAFQKEKGLAQTGKDGFETREFLKKDPTAGIEIIPERDRLRFSVNPFPKFPTQRHVRRFYGKPGTGHTTIEVPFDMFLAWDKRYKVRKVTLHEKCAKSAERALQEIASIYSAEEIKDIGIGFFGGTYNNRKMRGGSSLSTHAYAAAWDTDPERNGLRVGEPEARLSQEDAIPFWLAWEKQGWVSLGRERNFDWMHVQAVRL